jgi:hypothetical protein
VSSRVRLEEPSIDRAGHARLQAIGQYHRFTALPLQFGSRVSLGFPLLLVKFFFLFPAARYSSSMWQ